MPALIVAEAALADIVDIQLYGILTFGLKASDHYAVGLRAAIARLTDFPQLAAELSNLDGAIRILPYRSHIVVYAYDGATVRILRVRHAFEDWYDNPIGELGDDP